MRRLSLILLLVSLASPMLAQADSNESQAPHTQAEAALLQKMQSAARELDYSGVYTYQQGVVMLSSRVVHLVDGTGERERIETLEGTPREFVRHNEVTQSLLPDRKVVVVEQRHSERFPSLLLFGNEDQVVKYYDVTTLDGTQRVAGRDCTVINLTPRDTHRYGHVLCVDVQSHLLLKAQTITHGNEILDQVGFVSLSIGKAVADERVSASWDTEKWRVIDVPMRPVDLAEKGWRIPQPPGFNVVTQVSRPLRANDYVNQLVLSDGLAAISVFVEPFDTRRHSASNQGGVHKGALSVFRKRVGDYWLTVLGQVPADTLHDIAEHVEYVPLAH